MAEQEKHLMAQAAQQEQEEEKVKRAQLAKESDAQVSGEQDLLPLLARSCYVTCHCECADYK